jgi:hypothetical protein
MTVISEVQNQTIPLCSLVNPFSGSAFLKHVPLS